MNVWVDRWKKNREDWTGRQLTCGVGLFPHSWMEVCIDMWGDICAGMCEWTSW